MATILLEYDARNAAIKELIDAILSMGAKQINETNKSVYNQSFVKEILQSEDDIKHGKGKAIKTEDLWK